MGEKEKCEFCTSTLEEKINHDDYAVECVCPICGAYSFSRWDKMDHGCLVDLSKDMVASYLYHNNKVVEKRRLVEYTVFIGSKKHYDGLKEKHQNYYYVSIDEIMSFWPYQFSDRINKILLALSMRCRFFGEQLKMSTEEAKSLLFISRYDENGQLLHYNYIEMQYRELYDYFKDNSLVKFMSHDHNVYVTMQSEGWRRVDNIQQSEISNRKVFIAISFSKETKKIRSAIEEGIRSAEFNPIIMTDLIHNKQIVPEMFRLIRESRALIMDITEPNYGAYYEAGYALGLGKEVIISCKATAFDRKFESEEEKKYERFIKPHFDIAQRQILKWNNCPDLAKQVEEWIKALIR